jgi:hypothetical protein
MNTIRPVILTTFLWAIIISIQCVELLGFVFQETWNILAQKLETSGVFFCNTSYMGIINTYNIGHVYNVKVLLNITTCNIPLQGHWKVLVFMFN